MHTALAVLAAASPLAAADAPADPVVGAIRWDAWRAGSEWEQNLSPKQWHGRVPFYGRIVGEEAVEVAADSQEVMDQEIAYASAAGLDYWAYCFNLDGEGQIPATEYAVRLHLASARRTDVHVCFVLMSQGWWGPKEEWSRAAEAYAGFFRDEAYQKVLGNRPLLYIFYVDKLPEYFGSVEATRAGLEMIRAKSVEAGLGPAYIVAQVWGAESGAKCVDEMGFDAISAYAWADFSHGDQGYPYSTLAAANQAYWEACRATGKPAVPIVLGQPPALARPQALRGAVPVAAARPLVRAADASGAGRQPPGRRGLEPRAPRLRRGERGDHVRLERE
jgi:hypothetical protein